MIKLKPDDAGSLPADGGTPDSPPDDQKPADTEDSQLPKDVEGSSADDGKPKEKEPSLLEEIEKAIAEEKGEPIKEPDKDAEPSKKPPEDKKPEGDEDENLHEVPEDVKEGSKAHTRFQKLVTSNKDFASQNAELTQEVTNMRESVKDTGMDKGEFSQLMDYATLRKKGDPRKALEFLDVERKALLLQIGEPIEPPGILSDFPDLQKKVTDGDLSIGDGVRLAQADIKSKKDQELEDQQKADQKDQADFAGLVEENRQKVIEMEKKWAANDVDFAAKKELLIGQLGSIRQQPPAQWPALVQNAYDLISETVKSASSKGKLLNPESPVRKGEGDGGAPEPKTLLEAIDLALGVK